MLQFLTVSNLALLEHSELEFAHGFTAVTGETGAGKSVLLGALSLLAGNRADKSVIRKGADECVVEGALHFADSARIDKLLDSLGLPPCEEGALILRRVLSRNKAARVQINGALATLTALKELGETWIDFHGPGEPQKLFHERNQLAMLDLYASLAKQLDTYQADYTHWRSELARLDALRHEEKLDPDEFEFLSSQLEKLDTLDLSEEAIAQLEADFKRLANAQDIAATASSLDDGLRGDDGITQKLTNLIRAAHELARMDESTEPLAQRLDSAIIELEDIGSEYAELATSADIDEEAAADIQHRMESWLSLKRKYGNTAAAVLENREALRRRLDEQGDIEGAILNLEKQCAEQEVVLRKQATAMHQARTKAADKLGKRASTLLKKLGFKKAILQIDLTERATLTDTGLTDCSYQFMPNPGQDLLPLNKIASSGESARVMLALKAVLAEEDSTPLLVFDEVDANVGGEIGAEVGKELASLATNHQVLCVTHLPQVAACAASHLLVTKNQTSKSTSVAIEPIHGDEAQRIDELARMLGDRKAKSAQEHARKLLRG